MRVGSRVRARVERAPAFAVAMRVASACLVAITTTASLSAHRVDELLHAARIDVGVARATLSLDLTPGTEIAPALLKEIDTDGDGQLSKSEAGQWVQDVVRTLRIAIDDEAHPMSVIDSQLADRGALETGQGSLSIRLEAEYPSLDDGRHVLTFENSYKPAFSVYLANALVPSDGRVSVNEQTRDSRQTKLDITFQVATASTRVLRIVSAVIGAACVLFALIWLRRSR